MEESNNFYRYLFTFSFCLDRSLRTEQYLQIFSIFPPSFFNLQATKHSPVVMQTSESKQWNGLSFSSWLTHVRQNMDWVKEVSKVNNVAQKQVFHKAKKRGSLVGYKGPAPDDTTLGPFPKPPASLQSQNLREQLRWDNTLDSYRHSGFVYMQFRRSDISKH